MMTRRDFLRTTTGATALAAGLPLGCRHAPGPGGILDTHTHFYDPTRRQGVPWPPKDDAVLYRRVLPRDFRALAEPLGISGTVVVEASPWEEDNQWILDLAAQDPFLLGLIGHLKPGRPGFRDHLLRYAAHRRFRGIRTGGWNGGLPLDDPAWKRDVGLLADLDLGMDLLIAAEQFPEAVRIAESFPSLRIVIDHCCNVPVRTPLPDAWIAGVRAARRHQNLVMKVSGLVEGTGRTDGTAPRDVGAYRFILDPIADAFGEDRMVFGSNWPVSERFAPLPTVVGIVDDYFSAHGATARAKFFSHNARRWYLGAA
jgi:L-fuconolactonase